MPTRVARMNDRLPTRIDMHDPWYGQVRIDGRESNCVKRGAARDSMKMSLVLRSIKYPRIRTLGY
jgi:hypothetical protein